MMKSKKRISAVIVAALMLAAGTAGFAQKHFMLINVAHPEVKVLLSATVERDDARIPVEKASIVKSGELLDWTIESSNEGNAPAHDYKAVGQIPPGTEFVSGTAMADGPATVTYSIDHGKSFSVQPMIDERQEDGSINKVPAPVSMYTQIRYEWADPLEKNGKLIASYKVRLR